MNHCGVNHILFIHILCSVFGHAGVGCAGGHAAGVSIHVDACAQHHLLVADKLSHGGRNHVHDVAVAIQLLGDALAEIRQLIHLVPDAHRVVHKRTDTHLLGIGLAHAQHCGVSVENNHIIIVNEVFECQTVCLQQRLVGTLGSCLLFVSKIIQLIRTSCECHCNCCSDAHEHQHCKIPVLCHSRID